MYSVRMVGMDMSPMAWETSVEMLQRRKKTKQLARSRSGGIFVCAR